MNNEPLWLYALRRFIRTLLLLLIGFVFGAEYTKVLYEQQETAEVVDTCTPHLFDDHCGCLEDSLIQDIDQ